MGRRKNTIDDIWKYIDVRGEDECWPWVGGLSQNGRPYFQVDGVKHAAYRLVYVLFNGVALGDDLCRHTCDNPVCCNPKHLLRGSNDDNVADRSERERQGMPHDTVREIYRLAHAGVSQKEIARRFGISHQLVSNIKTGKRYGHVHKA